MAARCFLPRGPRVLKGGMLRFTFQLIVWIVRLAVALVALPFTAVIFAYQYRKNLTILVIAGVAVWLFLPAQADYRLIIGRSLQVSAAVVSDWGTHIDRYNLLLDCWNRDVVVLWAKIASIFQGVVQIAAEELGFAAYASASRLHAQASIPITPELYCSFEGGLGLLGARFGGFLSGLIFDLLYTIRELVSSISDFDTVTFFDVVEALLLYAWNEFWDDIPCFQSPRGFVFCICPAWNSTDDMGDNPVEWLGECLDARLFGGNNLLDALRNLFGQSTVRYFLDSANDAIACMLLQLYHLGTIIVSCLTKLYNFQVGTLELIKTLAASIGGAIASAAEDGYNRFTDAVTSAFSDIKDAAEEVLDFFGARDELRRAERNRLYNGDVLRQLDIILNHMANNFSSQYLIDYDLGVARGVRPRVYPAIAPPPPRNRTALREGLGAFFTARWERERTAATGVTPSADRVWRQIITAAAAYLVEEDDISAAGFAARLRGGNVTMAPLFTGVRARCAAPPIEPFAAAPSVKLIDGEWWGVVSGTAALLAIALLLAPLIPAVLAVAAALIAGAGIAAAFVFVSGTAAVAADAIASGNVDAVGAVATAIWVTQYIGLGWYRGDIASFDVQAFMTGLVPQVMADTDYFMQVAMDIPFCGGVFNILCPPAPVRGVTMFQRAVLVIYCENDVPCTKASDVPGARACMQGRSVCPGYLGRMLIPRIELAATTAPDCEAEGYRFDDIAPHQTGGLCWLNVWRGLQNAFRLVRFLLVYMATGTFFKWSMLSIVVLCFIPPVQSVGRRGLVIVGTGLLLQEATAFSARTIGYAPVVDGTVACAVIAAPSAVLGGLVIAGFYAIGAVFVAAGVPAAIFWIVVNGALAVLEWVWLFGSLFVRSSSGVAPAPPRAPRRTRKELM